MIRSSKNLALLLCLCATVVAANRQSALGQQQPPADAPTTGSYSNDSAAGQSDAGQGEASQAAADTIAAKELEARKFDAGQFDAGQPSGDGDSQTGDPSDPSRRRALVSAAVSNAMHTLRMAIGAEYITHDLTVQQFLDATSGGSEFDVMLQNSQMIGGPRWPDDQTCQVRIQIDGQTVARALTHICLINPELTPLSPDALDRRMLTWRRRVFTATGASTGGGDLEHILPPPARAGWADVPDDARQGAVDAARHDAANRVVSSIRPVVLVAGTTIGDALAVPTVGSAVNQWLFDRPVCLVDFLDNRKIKVTLSASPDELFAVFQGAVRHQTAVPFPRDQHGWTQVKQGMSIKMAPPVGISAVETKPVTQPASLLPRQPPAWTDRQITADGDGPATTSLLRAAHLAEDAAVAKLRDQLRDLPLSPSQTLGQAADHDGRIADALDRVLSRAHVSKADYHADGSVRVSVTLDLQEVWEELEAGRSGQSE